MKVRLVQAVNNRPGNAAQYQQRKHDQRKPNEHDDQTARCLAVRQLLTLALLGPLRLPDTRINVLVGARRSKSVRFVARSAAL